MPFCCPEPPRAEWQEREPSWHEDARADIREFITLIRRRTPAVTERSLAERFREHAEKWARETAFMSATPMVVMHDSYQAIIAMGPDVVPLLLRDLQAHKRHWFWALRHLTGADPVNEKDRGHTDRMIAAWVAWGKAQGKI
jgi:hypothetical protein